MGIEEDTMNTFQRYNALSEQEKQERHEKKINSLVAFLNKNGCTNIQIEKKLNWGDIVVFFYKGRKMHTNGFNRKKIPETYEYSSSYSCKRTFPRWKAY